jgi:hypothetical protein
VRSLLNARFYSPGHTCAHFNRCKASGYEPFKVAYCCVLRQEPTRLRYLLNVSFSHLVLLAHISTGVNLVGLWVSLIQGSLIEGEGSVQLISLYQVVQTSSFSD